jgi:hypothetical protein
LKTAGGRKVARGFKSHPRRSTLFEKGRTERGKFSRWPISRVQTISRSTGGLIADPEAFAREANAASWLFLCGEEFAAMEGGMSYASVQAVVPESANVVSDPPRVLDTDLARQQVAALDQLPRPTLVTCRVGPRSSALVYLYAGLRAGASADEVLARAEADDAPFIRSDELKSWVAQNLEELS